MKQGQWENRLCKDPCAVGLAWLTNFQPIESPNLQEDNSEVPIAGQEGAIGPPPPPSQF